MCASSQRGHFEQISCFWFEIERDFRYFCGAQNNEIMTHRQHELIISFAVLIDRQTCTKKNLIKFIITRCKHKHWHKAFSADCSLRLRNSSFFCVCSKVGELFSCVRSKLPVIGCPFFCDLNKKKSFIHCSIRKHWINEEEVNGASNERDWSSTAKIQSSKRAIDKNIQRVSASSASKRTKSSTENDNGRLQNTKLSFFTLLTQIHIISDMIAICIENKRFLHRKYHNFFLLLLMIFQGKREHSHIATVSDWWNFRILVSFLDLVIFCLWNSLLYFKLLFYVQHRDVLSISNPNSGFIFKSSLNAWARGIHDSLWTGKIHLMRDEPLVYALAKRKFLSESQFSPNFHFSRLSLEWFTVTVNECKEFIKSSKRLKIIKVSKALKIIKVLKV